MITVWWMRCPVDAWLAGQPNTGAVAQFPFSEESSQGLTYDTLVNQKPSLGGNFNSYGGRNSTRGSSALAT